MPPPPPATRADGAGSTAEGHGKNGRFEARNTLSTASLSFSDGKKLRFKGFLSEMRFLFPVEAADGTKPGVTRTTANGLPRARGGHGTDTLPLRHACQHASGPRTARPSSRRRRKRHLGKESEDERENVSLGAGRPQPPARAKHSPGAPPGAGETPPTTLIPGASCRARGRTGHRHGSFRSTRGRTEGRTPAPRALRGRVGLGQAPGAPAMCAMRGVGRRRSQSPTAGGFPSSAACCPNWRVVGSSIARLALRSSVGRPQCRARGGAHCDPHPPGSVPSGSRDRPPGGEGRP